MAFDSSTVSVGDSTKKSFADQLIANDNWNKGRLDTVYDGINTFAGDKTFSGNTIFSGTIIYDGASRVRATNADAQVIENATYTIIEYDTVIFDNLGEYDNITNYRFTAQKAGYYLVSAALISAAVEWTENEAFVITIYKNGARYSLRNYDTAGATVTRRRSPSITDIVYLAAGEYLDIRGRQDIGVNMALEADADYNYFTVHRLS